MTHRLRRGWAWATTGPAFPLITFLAIALLLRLPAVLFADGYEYADQQYQYVDPAWQLATHDAWLPTWEWDLGMRSWVYPSVLSELFQVLRSLGVEEPFALMRAVRAVHALISLLPLWLFWLAIVRWRPVAAPRLPLLLLAACGLAVTTGVQPSGPALAATLGVAAVLAFHGPRWFPALGGLLLGLAFCARIQEALFGPAVVIVGLVGRRYAATALFAAGCIPGILIQGCFDLVTWGSFLASPWRYFEVNVLEGAAARYTTQPPWFYVAALLPTLMLIPPWWNAAWRALKQGSQVLPAALAAGLLHLIVHSFLARKAMRFEYGALTLLIAVAATGLGAVATTPDRRRTSYAVALGMAQAIVLVYVSAFAGHVGPVRAADFLRRQWDFRGELLVVGGSATSVGGAYYLRRESLHVTSVEHAKVAAHFETTISLPRFVLTTRKPLPPAAAASAGYDLIGTFRGRFDLRGGDRRWVYRRRS